MHPLENAAFSQRTPIGDTGRQQLFAPKLSFMRVYGFLNSSRNPAALRREKPFQNV